MSKTLGEFRQQQEQIKKMLKKQALNESKELINTVVYAQRDYDKYMLHHKEVGELLDSLYKQVETHLGTIMAVVGIEIYGD